MTWEPPYEISEEGDDLVIHIRKDRISRERFIAFLDSLASDGIEPEGEPVRESPRSFGALKGRIDVPDSLFHRLPDDELDAWDQ